MAASWTDDMADSNASSMRYGKRRRGKGTYCIFKHSDAMAHFPIDCIENDIRTVIDNLDVVGNDIHGNQLGINLQEIGATVAQHAPVHNPENRYNRQNLEQS